MSIIGTVLAFLPALAARNRTPEDRYLVKRLAEALIDLADARRDLADARRENFRLRQERDFFAQAASQLRAENDAPLMLQAQRNQAYAAQQQAVQNAHYGLYLYQQGLLGQQNALPLNPGQFHDCTCTPGRADVLRRS
jgi:hypothetical protein